MILEKIRVRRDVADKLRALKTPGESISCLLDRLLDDDSARTVGEWLNSLAPLEGRGIFSPAERERLKRDQRNPKRPRARRRRIAR
jgi:hypothetical protein